MNCKDFWRRYEDSGLIPELEAHLRECPGCQREMEIESAFLKIAENLPAHTAPETLWDSITHELPEILPELSRKRKFTEVVTGFINELFSHLPSFQLKPVIVGLTIIITSILATHYYYTRFSSPADKIRLQREVVRDLEEIEREYLAAIDKLTENVEMNKDAIDPELYDLYSEKLAVLDEYILQCREAFEENEFNPQVRKYLALAYMEKMDTLREMSEQHI